MSRKSKSGGLEGVISTSRDGKIKSRGSAGSGMGVQVGKTKSGGSEQLGMSVKEEERFLDIDDLQEVIDGLKSPPDVLTWEDFRDRYDLECGPNSINPHRCRKDKDISDKTMLEFGLKPEGVKGRGGYSWSDCKVREIVNRIKYLHPIVYQHGPEEIPRCVTKQFAVGVVLEYQKNLVNWALYGQETNNSQRRKYEQDLSKLQFAINTGAKVTKRTWRSLKVDVAVKVKLEPNVGMEAATPTKRRAIAPPGNVTTSRRVGTKSEFANSTVKVEDRGIASMSKLEYFQTMHTVLLMEIEGLKLDEELAKKAKDGAAQDQRLALLMVESYEANLASLQNADVAHPGNEAKRSLLAELLEEQKQCLGRKEAEALQRDLAAEECRRLREQKTRMCEGVKVEIDRIKYGRQSASLNPVPLVYPDSAFGEDESPERRFLKITMCALCGFNFPKSDIIIASCKHMYHPFCAKVTYENGYKCAAANCSDKLVDPDWHRSFGWGGPGTLVVEDVAAQITMCDEEVARLLAERAERARLRCPNTDSSLKPMSCLSHGLASGGEQSQAVSTRFRDSAGGETFTSSLQVVREHDGGKMVVDSPVKFNLETTRSRTSIGRSEGRKSGAQAQLPPEKVFECLEKDSRGKSKVTEPEFIEESEEEDSEPEEKCPDLPSNSGTTISGSNSESKESDDEDDEEESGHSPQVQQVQEEKPKEDKATRLDIEKKFRDEGLIQSTPVQMVLTQDIEAVERPREEDPRSDAGEGGVPRRNIGLGSGEVKRDSDMELDSEIEGGGETKGKVGGDVHVLKVIGEEGLDEGQEEVLEQDSLEIWGRPWTSLVQSNMALDVPTNQDKECEEGENPKGMEQSIEGDEAAQGVQNEAKEKQMKEKQVKGKRKSLEGRRLQEELEAHGVIGISGGGEHEPAQRTRASRRSSEGDDLATQRKSKGRRQKDCAVEKGGQKKSSKRKSKETPSLRNCPNVGSPGCSPSPSGKKLKPVNSVLESSN
ncbi:hypothetical protein M758_4G174300 [Ceratodon purpureus]|nr:hypothetical protein M758_4G174300 [Ceratodon purpureus]